MHRIFDNVDVLVLILQFLEIREQIFLCGVCDDFKDVIVEYIWRRRYRRLQVYKLKDDLFILNRNYKRGLVGKAAFHYERFERVRKNEIEMFLLLQQEYILDLELCDYRGHVYTGLPHIFVNVDWNFPNLRMLKLNSIQLNVEHFNTIKNKCLNLKVLHLNRCLSSDWNMLMLKDRHDPLYNGLLDVVNMLTEFHMEFQATRSSPYPLTLYDFLYKRILKVLHLDMPINYIDDVAIPPMEENTCEELHLGAINQYRVLQKLIRLNSNAFKNLQILTLEGSLSKLLIRTYFIQQLAVAAPKLKNLQLKRCDIEVDDFRILESLTDISFDNCLSLTWKNMNQLLQSPHIHSYSSKHSNYMGPFESISLSYSLKSLTLDGSEGKFKHIYVDDNKLCKNLKYLHYHDGTQTIFSNISTCFPNLEVLIILPYHLDEKDFSRLTKLKVYKAPHYMHDIMRKEFLFIIQHPSLRELSLAYCQCLVEPTFNVTHEDLNTNLKYISLDHCFFTSSRNTWFTMLTLNPQLTITVSVDEVNDLGDYYEILTDKHFTRKYIRLSGYYFDFDHIYNTPEIAEENINLATQIALHRDLLVIM